MSSFKNEFYGLTGVTFYSDLASLVLLDLDIYLLLVLSESLVRVLLLNGVSFTGTRSYIK